MHPYLHVAGCKSSTVNFSHPSFLPDRSVFPFNRLKRTETLIKRLVGPFVA